jgi:oligopeptide/dipeptide ABC transporter ATP-binding protein
MYAGKIVEMGTLSNILNQPRHPYTEALITCIPPVDRDVDYLPSLPGQPPKLYALPEGCYFASRCSYAMEICRKESPPEVKVEEGHTAACWKYV